MASVGYAGLLSGLACSGASPICGGEAGQVALLVMWGLLTPYNHHRQ